MRWCSVGGGEEEEWAAQIVRCSISSSSDGEKGERAEQLVQSVSMLAPAREAAERRRWHVNFSGGPAERRSQCEMEGVFLF